MRVVAILLAAALLAPPSESPARAGSLLPETAALLDTLASIRAALDGRRAIPYEEYDARREEFPFLFDLHRATADALLAAYNARGRAAVLDDAAALVSASREFAPARGADEINPAEFFPELASLARFVLSEDAALGEAEPRAPSQPEEVGAVIALEIAPGAAGRTGRGERPRLYWRNGAARRFAGIAPGALALPPGRSVLEVLGFEHQYRLDLRVGDGSVEVASFRWSGDCRTVDPEEARRLDALAAAIESRRLDASGGRLELPALDWGDPGCAYYLDFGATRYFRVRIASDPAPASVYVDGDFVAQTPATVIVRADNRGAAIVLRKPGYADAPVLLNPRETEARRLEIAATLVPVGP